VPELPEVETVRRQLAESLLGKTFTAVRLFEPSMLRDCTPDQLEVLLPGRRIDAVDRMGKFLVLPLSPGAGGASDSDVVFLTLHLGMTGQLLVDPRDAGPEMKNVHTRFLFELRDGAGNLTWLEFRDIRKFGRLHLTKGAPAPRLRALGPDAWLGAWDADYLQRRLRGRKAPLKAFLLDQRHLSGIGNIYADEILWWTRLSPLRASGSLSIEEVTRLAEEIPRRLGEGVKLLGCTLSDFVDTEGRPGGFQEQLQAYGRQGQVCFRCGETLARVIVGGRGTSYCPGCQR
jgi:formamidopyrimidine-DNA glycosylase